MAVVKDVVPVYCPRALKIYSLCLLCDGRHRLHGVEQLALLLRVLDAGVDEQGVHLAVDVLDGDLEL